MAAGKPESPAWQGVGVVTVKATEWLNVNGYGGQGESTLSHGIPIAYQRGSDRRRRESSPPNPPVWAGLGRASLTVRPRPPS